MTRSALRGILWLASFSIAACGGNQTPPPSPDPAGVTITITSAGASPRSVTVQRGTQVTFVNQDAVVHQMYSDPHPEHTDCPEFDSVGQLTPGATRQTSNLATARTCNFHDHLNPNNAALKGSVTIQ